MCLVLFKIHNKNKFINKQLISRIEKQIITTMGLNQSLSVYTTLWPLNSSQHQPFFFLFTLPVAQKRKKVNINLNLAWHHISQKNRQNSSRVSRLTKRLTNIWTIPIRLPVSAVSHHYYQLTYSPLMFTGKLMCLLIQMYFNGLLKPSNCICKHRFGCLLWGYFHNTFVHCRCCELLLPDISRGMSPKMYTWCKKCEISA